MQIESLPMNGAQGGTLQNVLSISTAANNRYLLHFNSLNSLTQWTAGIRLAMFEHSTLQEAYTGSLIAGKGKYLNNIKQIMDRSRFIHEDWVRVRFGAGTPWKRCWCVITPPDEKEFQKSQKTLKKNPYERARLPKGDIRFYESRKVTKKTRPIATISDAYAAYAIYPQSKPLIDQSSLVKVEGLITQHKKGQETTTEAFVFVMPEVHPAVSGFEMMLRWLFPVYDTFNLYGRPNRLIADTLDQRGLMFAMPRDRRYGYLDSLDVSGLIHTSGSQSWSERQWRKELKKLTSTRMQTAMDNAPRTNQFVNQHRRSATNTSRSSMPPSRQALRFEDGASTHSSPGSRSGSPSKAIRNAMPPPSRVDSAPPATFASPHKRAASDVYGYRKFAVDSPSRLSQESARNEDYYGPPAPPPHLSPSLSSGEHVPTISTYERAAKPTDELPPPQPVLSPPPFAHNPNSRPAGPLTQAPELRRAHSNVDEDTLHQMQDAVRATEAQDEEQYGSPQPPPHGSQESFLPFRPYEAVSSAQHYNHASERNGDYAPREPQRLSTIPGSPYIADTTEYFHRSQQQPPQHLPAVNESGAGSTSHPPAPTQDGRPPLISNRSSQSIQRKPVPRPVSQATYDGSQVRNSVVSSSPDSPSSPVGSFVGAIIDQDVLERILNEETPSRSSTMQTNASSATPDYASTVSKSSQGDRAAPVEKPRAGKMKIVGDPTIPTTNPKSGGAGRLDTYNRDIAVQQSTDLPQIDFGPTYSYKPTTRPGTSGTLTPGESHKRNKSTDRLRSSSRDRLSGYFGHETRNSSDKLRQSYIGTDGTSPVETDSRRQSVAWTPAISPGLTAVQRQALTPEQWVQQRAALASQPQVPPPRKVSPAETHQRQSSTHSLTQQLQRQSLTKTPPPFGRSGSGDWTQLRDGNRPPSRPNSRGAGAVLSASPGGGGLSAREQMHVARATGTPLLGLPGANSSPHGSPMHSPGLVGSLAAREREKAALNEGIRSTQVQHAIAARQQQQMQLEAEMEAQRFHQQQQMQMQIQASQLQQMAAFQNAAMMQQQQQQQLYQSPMASPSVYIPHGVAPQTPSPGAGSVHGHWRGLSTGSSSSLRQMQPPPQPVLPAGAGSGFGNAFMQQQRQAVQQAPVAAWEAQQQALYQQQLQSQQLGQYQGQHQRQASSGSLHLQQQQLLLQQQQQQQQQMRRGSGQFR